MKKSALIVISVVILFAIVFILPDLASSQPPPPIKPEQNPIDGGLGLLAAAGGAYAIKKLRDKKT